MLAALLGWSGSARGEDAIPVRISLEGPSGCSTSEEFYRALAKRTERLRPASADEPAFDVRVRLVQTPRGVQGELRVVSDRGEADTRAVDGSSCSVVVEALSLTASLALDAAEEREKQLEAEQGAGARAAKKDGAAAPSGPERDDTEKEDENDDDEAELDGARSRWLGVEVGVHAVVARVLAPEVNVGGALVLRLVVDASEHLKPSLGLALVHAGAELGDKESDATARWTAAVVTACPVRWELSPVIGLRPCALGTGGRVSVTGEGLTNARAAERSWWSAGGALRLDGRLGDFSVELEGGVTLPFSERRFVVAPSERILLESPAISPVGSVGVVYVF